MHRAKGIPTRIGLYTNRPIKVRSLASGFDAAVWRRYVQLLNALCPETLSDMLVPDSSILRVLRLLDATPRLTQRDMARELGVSLGKANYCMRALIGKGFVKVQNFRNSTNKRAYLYLLTPDGAAAKAKLTRNFLALKREEYDALRLEVERLPQESESIAEGL